MTDERRGSKAYLWTSWAKDFLGGGKCEWQPWYKAHYRYTKRPRTDDASNLDEWIKQHDAMVRARVGLLRADGIAVSVEGQNQFKLEGRTLIVAGKPDIIAKTTPTPTVIDEKSGTPRASDQWQVLLYMWALPRILNWGKLQGELEYRGGEKIQLPLDRLTPETTERIVRTLQMIGGDEPRRTPSAEECQFCDILACPDRIVTTVAEAVTQEF